MKKLYRPKENRVIAGVFAGLGLYFDIDPTILRLVFAVCTAFSGFIPGIAAYIAAAIIIPEYPAHEHKSDHHDHDANPQI